LQKLLGIKNRRNMDKQDDFNKKNNGNLPLFIGIVILLIVVAAIISGTVALTFLYYRNSGGWLNELKNVMSSINRIEQSSNTIASIEKVNSDDALDELRDVMADIRRREQADVKPVEKKAVETVEQKSNTIAPIEKINSHGGLNELKDEMSDVKRREQADVKPVEKKAVETVEQKSNTIAPIEKVDPDFGPYMRELQRTIKTNWQPPKDETSNRVVLLFKIRKDGKLMNSSVYKTSGNKKADNAALKAVKESAPFRPLPVEYKGQSVDIQFTFDYNLINLKKERI